MYMMMDLYVKWTHVHTFDYIIGDWVIFETPGDPVDEVWIGRAVSNPDWGMKCNRVHNGPTKKVNGLTFHKGDVGMFVKWYERVSDTSNLYSSFTGDCKVQNCCLLRSRVSHLDLERGPPVVVSNRSTRSTRSRINQIYTPDPNESDRVYILDHDVYQHALNQC